MPDRKKVIKGLKCCCSTGRCFDGCPYYDASKNSAECSSQLVLEVLDLLKEHEVVEPICRHSGEGIFVWTCGSCGAYMYHIYNGIDKAKEYAKYCRQCGRKVKWDG